MSDDHVEYPPPAPAHRRRPVDRRQDNGSTAPSESQPISRRSGHRGLSDTGTVPAVQPRTDGTGSARRSAERVPGSATVWIVTAGLVILATAGALGWLANRNDGGQASKAGDGDQVAADETVPPTDDQAAVPPLAPAQLPAADEAGLVGLDLLLLDAYTGTGSTGSVELYINTLTGQVCHRFEAPAMPDRFRAYIREAVFPQEGPIVVDLGDVANATPLCVSSTPIDLARAIDDGTRFYVAAQSPDRDMLLRGQLSEAALVFDNRDPAIAVEPPEGEDTAGNDLFGRADEGAYLVVEAGRVAFEGVVPDDATAQQLRAAFVPLSGLGVEIVDNLSVEPGAPPPSGRVLVANALLFDSGEFQVDAGAPVLQTLADIMAVNPTWTMTITGHTDNVGSFDANDQLSLRRADSVRTRLTELGVELQRLRVQGAGAEFPIADNSTEEGRAQNRRIEITIDSSG